MRLSPWIAVVWIGCTPREPQPAPVVAMGKPAAGPADAGAAALAPDAGMHERTRADYVAEAGPPEAEPGTACERSNSVCSCPANDLRCNMMCRSRYNQPAPANMLADCERACASGHAGSCLRAGLYYLREKSPKARQLLQQACDGGEYPACTHLHEAGP